jgi:hypothetical protein
MATKMKSGETTTSVLPAFLASALINGDMTSFDDSGKDMELYERCLAYCEGFVIVDCGEPYFSRNGSDVQPYSGDVCEYALLKL